MSVGEFIELRDLVQGQDSIELTGSHAPRSPPRLERTNALRISAGKVPELLSRVGIIRVLSSRSDPQPAEESGEGHSFQPCSHTQPTWCDLCGDFIWGLYKQSLRCINCKFTCHYRCQPLIQLDCIWDQGSLSETTCVFEHTIETDTDVVRIFYSVLFLHYTYLHHQLFEQLGHSCFLNFTNIKRFVLKWRSIPATPTSTFVKCSHS